MTGVGDIICAVRRRVRRSPTMRALLTLLDYGLEYGVSQLIAEWVRALFFPRWWVEDLKGSSLAWVQQRRPDCRETMKLLNVAKQHDQPQSTQDQQLRQPLDDSTSQVIGGGGQETKQWGFLLPITSRGAGDVWKRLETNLRQLVRSMSPCYRLCTKVFVGIDINDPVFDNDEARERIRALLGELSGVQFASPLVPAFQGKICWIWAELAAQAVAQGAELFVLLGDDVFLHTHDWQHEVEQQFTEISQERGLPYGCACVAIQDRSFTSFPTFPVIHSTHLEVFDGNLFPPEFMNQHGDPFLFELYRRWGAARFTPCCSLTNCIGGADDARYRKAGSVHWKGLVLTRAIDRLADFLSKTCPGAKEVACIDIVIPTYRCEVETLRKLCSLDCEQPASTHTIIVVDKPTTSNLEEIRALASYTADRTVRVHVQEANAGASVARNTGLAQSFGDYVVLLDDDVVPEPGLLDAYIGAIARHPGEAIYVGLTKLPAPVTWTQCALNACRICYFYGIAELKQNPPWGVTANLCVRNRTVSNKFKFFSKDYPRTGGGEDVDFCIRSTDAGHGKLIAVPAAKVTHPYWDAPFSQIIGWAKGDVLCLGCLPHAVFCAPPNWVEIALGCILVALGCELFGGQAWLGVSSAQAFCCAMLATPVEIAMLLPRFFMFAKGSPKNQLLVALFATAPPMLQDVVRLQSKLSRGRLSELCHHFDWMNGTGDHPSETSSNIKWKFMAWAVTAWAVQSADSRKIAVTLLVTLYTLWVIRHNGMLLLGGWKRQAPRPPLDIEIEPGKTPFVVFAYQRTGSNMLIRNHMNKHPGVHMHFELFNEKAIYTQSQPGETKKPGVIKDLDVIRARDKDPAGFLERMIRESPAAAVGFKFFPEHARDVDFLDRLLADNRIRKVILRRDNRLACLTSIIRASVTGAYIHVSHDNVPVHITPTDFQTWVTCYDQYYAFLRDRLAGQDVVEITYESLVADASSTLQPVFRLLGLQPQSSNPQALAGDLQPQSSGSPRQAVVNYSELRGVFSSTDRERDFV